MYGIVYLWETGEGASFKEWTYFNSEWCYILTECIKSGDWKLEKIEDTIAYLRPLDGA